LYNSTGDKLIFTSYERDSESGNDYALARYYISRLGRFSSPDKMAGSSANPQSLNRYSYVLNNPGNLVDPSGQCGEMFDAQHRRKRLYWGEGGRSLPVDGFEAAFGQEVSIYDCFGDGGGGGGGGTSDPPAVDNSNPPSDQGVVDLTGILPPIQVNTNEPLPVDPTLPDNVVTFTIGGGQLLLTGGGGGTIPHAIQLSGLKSLLIQLFKTNDDCAKLLGGLDAALELLKRQNFVDTTTPEWLPPKNVPDTILSGISTVVKGINTAYTTWPTPSMSSQTWTGSNFKTYVAQPFFDLSPSAQQTANIHELSHPHLGTGDDSALPTEQTITDKCKTERAVN
jgi:RHS repeat-associated protein